MDLPLVATEILISLRTQLVVPFCLTVRFRKVILPPLKSCILAGF